MMSAVLDKTVREDVISNSVEGAVAAAARSLAGAGIGQARREARLLLAAALERTPTDLLSHPERIIEGWEITRFQGLVDQRCARRPMGQVLARRAFWTLEFRVEPCALDPRPDSECLVEAAIAHLSERKLSNRGETLDVLDLGVGTGCLLLSVLHETRSARGIGVDISYDACRLAKRNAGRLGLAARTRWIVGDWGAALDRSFDAILCNPPYIPSGEIAGLTPEVACHEPRAALDGGADGLDCYRRLLPLIGGFLKPGGALFLEVGYGQAGRVETLASQSALRLADVARDLGGRDRCLVLKRRTESES